MPNKYELQARITPALLCSVPFIAVGFYLLNKIDSSFWGSLLTLGVGGASMTAALYEFAVQSCRLVGKFFESLIFEDGKRFPTTTFLLDEDTNCSTQRKKAIIARVKEEFGITLYGKTSDSPENRVRISEAIGQIRKKHFSTSPTVLQYNIQYGFVRNLAGGSSVALSISVLALLGSLILSATTATYVFTCLTVAYTAVTVLSYLAIRFTAKHYAHALFDEFLSPSKSPAN